MPATRIQADVLSHKNRTPGVGQNAGVQLGLTSARVRTTTLRLVGHQLGAQHLDATQLHAQSLDAVYAQQYATATAGGWNAAELRLLGYEAYTVPRRARASTKTQAHLAEARAPQDEHGRPATTDHRPDVAVMMLRAYPYRALTGDKQLGELVESFDQGTDYAHAMEQPQGYAEHILHFWHNLTRMTRRLLVAVETMTRSVIIVVVALVCALPKIKPQNVAVTQALSPPGQLVASSSRSLRGPTVAGSRLTHVSLRSSVTS